MSVVSTSALGCGSTSAVSSTGICANTAGTHSIGILAANAVDINDGEDTDSEISKIDFKGVNLRSKKKRDILGTQSDEKDGDVNRDGEGCCDGSDNSHQQPERPMSWEGELSDEEMSSNTITNQVGSLSTSITCHSII